MGDETVWMCVCVVHLSDAISVYKGDGRDDGEEEGTCVLGLNCPPRPLYI